MGLELSQQKGRTGARIVNPERQTGYSGRPIEYEMAE